MAAESASLLTRDVHDVDVHKIAPNEDHSYNDDWKPADDSESAVTESSAG